MYIKINYRTIIVTFIIIYLPLSLTLQHNFNQEIWGYGDEVFSLLMLGYVLILLLKGKFLKKDMPILILLTLLTILGLISNIYSKLTNNLMAIFVDAFWQWKIFLAFLGAKYIAKNDKNNTIMKSLFKVAKGFLVICTLCGIINCFINLGMSYGYRYGIPSYYFIFYNEGRFGIIVAIALLIVLYGTDDSRVIRKYEILAILSMFFTTKGIVYIIIAMYIMLQMLFKFMNKKAKLNLKTIIPLFIVVIFVSSYQIENYLLNDISPRMLLIKYGIITAMSYFPLGSGLATYGSEMAARYYSPLYVKYGWRDRYAMGIENGTALNDNYLATIVGEFGFFGLIIMSVLFFIIFNRINKINTDVKVKSMILSLFLCMIIAFLATGITKSSIGVCVFIVLGVLTGLDEYKSLENESYYGG